jgi:hypothetical protein
MEFVLEKSLTQFSAGNTILIGRSASVSNTAEKGNRN